MALREVLTVFVAMLVFFLTMAGALAAPGVNMVDGCYNRSTWADDGSNLTVDLKAVNSCAGGNYIHWPNVLDLTILGDVVDGEVVVARDSMYVDAVARPDLDTEALLVFKVSPYVDPIILKDGGACGCNVTRSSEGLEVQVSGFSNYTLTARQDFSVHSDTNPELKDKVYQVADLGAAYRNTEFACIVEIFGQNGEGQWVLVQTNPERAVQAKILGNPDTNQPESLGYFPTKNGVANTYFRKANIYGYNEFEMVIRCSSTATQLVYEESVTPVYSPAGRNVVSRGVWLTSGSNGFYVVFYIFGGLIALWVIIMVVRRSFRRW